MSVIAGERPWDYDSAKRRPAPIEEAIDLAANARLISAFVVRDIKSRYKRSLFGILWSLAAPLLLMIVLTVAFSQAFAIGMRAFPAFVLPGLLLWNFFAQTTQTITGEVSAGIDLWRRVRVPKTAAAVSTVVTGAVHLALSVIALVPILLLLRVPFGWPILTLPAVIVLTALFTLGIALIVSAVALYFPDIGHIHNVVLSAWMFVTPVIYPLTILPPRIRAAIAWNPMTLFVSGFRDPLYSNHAPSLTQFGLMLLVSVATLLAGWFVFTQRADDIPYRG